MNIDLQARFDRMLSADLAMAQRNMIHQNPDGTYEVFGRWHIQVLADQVQVTSGPHSRHDFARLPAAVSWCIAQKYNQRDLAAEIVRLDGDFRRLRDQHQVRRAAAQALRDPLRRSIAMVKSQEAHSRYKNIGLRLAECARRAKYFQIRGFNDEIARTRRPAPHRTSRDGVRKPRWKTH
jgi:hypothetical protein